MPSSFVSSSPSKNSCAAASAHARAARRSAAPRRACRIDIAREKISLFRWLPAAQRTPRTPRTHAANDKNLSQPNRTTIARQYCNKRRRRATHRRRVPSSDNRIACASLIHKSSLLRAAQSSLLRAAQIVFVARHSNRLCCAPLKSTIGSCRFAVTRAALARQRRTGTALRRLQTTRERRAFRWRSTHTPRLPARRQRIWQASVTHRPPHRRRCWPAPCR